MSLSQFPPWLSLFLLLSLLLFIVRKKTTAVRRRKGCLPPGPHKLPIIGNLHQLGKLPHQSLRRLSQLYGPVMSMNLGGFETIIISSAKAAQALLKTYDLHSCSRPSTDSVRKLTHNLRDIAFSPYGDYWRDIRKICVLELFSVKRVKSYESIREEEVASLLDSISESSASATPVDLTEKTLSLTASIIFRTVFGRRLQTSDFRCDRVHKLVSDAEAMLGSYSAAEYFSVPYVGKIIDRLTGRHAKLERVFNELNALFQQVIDDHLCPERTKPEQDDVIDVLLAIKKQQTQVGGTDAITHENIKAVLLNIFLGGLDTSSITMVWAMAELIKQPKLMKKAQEEIRRYVGNKGRLTESDTEELPYLKMIVKETLRLHPPAPLLLPRETISHFDIEGYDFYPKTVVQVNAWAIGRDPNYWRDPEEFIPERFADSTIDYKGQHFELLPFGAGRRSCPAIYMGVKTVELALANLLYHFDWKLPYGMKEEDLNMEETSGLSLTVFKNLPLKLVPVTPSTTEYMVG